LQRPWNGWGRWVEAAATAAPPHEDLNCSASRPQTVAISVASSGALTATMPDLHKALPALPRTLPQGQILIEVLGYTRKYFNLFSD